MALYKSDKKAGNAGPALCMTLLLILAAWSLDGFYYDLNDDVLIKDILSGVYTGQPEGLTMQLLYPLGFFLSLLYQIPAVPVFGLFLCVCQFGSVFAIAYRTLGFCKNRKAKATALVVQLLFWLGACLEHFIFIQYTVTAGMLLAAAVFWMVTSKETESVKAFFKDNLPALLLYWIAFCLRSELGLLMLPLAGAAGFCKWFSGTAPLKRENLIRYIGLFGLLAAGLFLCLGIDSLAYGQSDWQSFRRYFDARTTIYDYQRDVVEAYEENRAIYEELGMSEVRQTLLQNYNFGADDRIDADFMEDLAQKAQARENGGLFRKSLREGLWELLRQHFLAKSDLCLNFVMIGLGILLFLTGFVKGRRCLLWEIPLLTACSSVLWLFILLRDRMLVRISVPLYLGTIAAFCGVWLMHEARRKAEPDPAAEEKDRRAGSIRQRLLPAAAILIAAACLLAVPQKIQGIRQQSAVRTKNNRVNEAVLAYCSAHPEFLFLEDVYSTVNFSEKIGVDRKKPFNYDLLGGWIVKSPLTKKKLQAFGLESMGEAVCGKEQVRLLVEAEGDFSWLEEFLKEQKTAGKAVCVDTIADGRVEVYQIVRE